MEQEKNQTVLLKKYPNRRLYDTENSKYVTLRDVAGMIRRGRRVEVIDVKTETDVTSFILAQIILEQVKQNNSVLPTSLLHLIIRFGEDVLSEFFDKYLEKTIQSYMHYKKTMDEQFKMCIELGMDFSNMAEKTIKELKPFQPFFPGDTEPGTKEYENEDDH